jgi:hypothetical protein
MELCLSAGPLVSPFLLIQPFFRPLVIYMMAILQYGCISGRLPDHLKFCLPGSPLESQLAADLSLGWSLSWWPSFVPLVTLLFF